MEKLPPSTRNACSFPLLRQYSAGVSRGDYVDDEYQRDALTQLEALAKKIAEQEQLSGKLSTRLGLRRMTPPNGIYLVGPVGRGKSMVMDLFFEALPSALKRRVHFHAFMRELHQRLHKAQQPIEAITNLAAQIARKANILCFDEVQITDMSEAVILTRLVDALRMKGTVVVATSNTPPLAFLPDHPNRSTIEPHLRKLAASFDVVTLNGGRDYRRSSTPHKPSWIVPCSDDSRRTFDRIFASISQALPQERSLQVGLRTLIVPLASSIMARFTFGALCQSNYAAGDYLKIAETFQYIIVEDIPILEKANVDEARRFITLIDILYDQRIVLFASAAAPIQRLYLAGEGSDMFVRTRSRLEEMTSEKWLVHGEVVHYTS